MKFKQQRRLGRRAVPWLIGVCLLLLTSVLSLAAANQLGYAQPDDCQTSVSLLDANKKALSCKLRAVNGAFDSASLGLIESRDTISLSLVCGDMLYESAIGNNSLSHLAELRELNIDNCKMRHLSADSFAGLSRLEMLRVRTRSESDWSTAEVSLSLSVATLAHLRRLETVDLSQSAINHLPENLFCGLPSLAALNLSANHFAEVNALGLSTKHRETRAACKVDTLQRLDLSRNRLKVLTDRGFAVLPKLEVLSLAYNLISRAEETGLTGLNMLRVLDMSNNELVALPPRFFTAVTVSLKELHLQNNSISVLPPGLFHELKALEMLDMSHNEITSHWINQETFGSLVRLESLDLSYNKLTRLEANTFRAQVVLSSLDLSNNEIESIGENAFATLHELRNLVLSNNRLSTIDAHTLNGLSRLMILSVDSNRLESVHGDAFANNTELAELVLKVNKLSSVPHAIASLHYLRSLDMSYNMISDISNTSYQGLEQLYGLNLEGNRVGNISKNAFADLPSLRILNVAKNQIKSIEKESFESIPDLHALRLDSNQLTDVNSLFSHLRDLLMLNVSVNRIEFFDYALIPVGLQWLDIHSNQIETLGNYFELEAVLKLRTLDVSRNKIAEMDASSLPDGIEIVFMQNNLLRKIAPMTFVGKQNLTRVDLTHNNLSTLDMNAFRLAKMIRARRQMPEFSVAGNPYLCDCNMEWMLRIGQMDETKQYPRFADADQIECQLAFKKHATSVPLAKADPSHFLCPYKSHCFALCHCCEFDACDCEMTCPENCTCYYDQSWNTNIVDCSAQTHNVVPSRIPMDVTELYLDGNDMPSLSHNTFIGRKHLRSLHLNNSNIHTINNRTFNGLKTLQTLNLKHNRLTTLHGYEFERLVDLKELYLSFNRISTIANNTFLNLRSLKVLHLDHNYVLEFQLWNLNYNSHLRDLRLSHNMWSCECVFIKQFTEWLPRKTNIIADASDIQCFFNETTGLALLADFNMSSCTNYSPRKVFGAQQFQVQDLVPVVAVSAALAALLVISLIVILIYRREMSVWFYSRYGVRLQGRAASRREEEKLFDAFVSYSKKDEAFVSQILAPELEYGSPPFRLCLHYRDLPVASGYLSDAIVEAMEASRRSVLVISENFLKGEWCRYEFKSAHLDVLRSNPNHKLILIFIGKINAKDFDPDIRFWLKNNVFLQWGEKMFWEKLRYAMPDIAFARKPCPEQTRDLTSVAVHI